VSTPTTVRYTWLWPLGLPAQMAGHLSAALGRLADRLGPWPVWLFAGALAGTLPAVLAIATGPLPARAITVALLVPLFLASVARDWLVRSLLLLAAAFAGHSALTIAYFHTNPAALPAQFPPGAAYWVETHSWLVTGESREYELTFWVPAHVQLLVAVVLFTYTSLGIVPLWEGFYEVDLMNGYVSQLLLHSHDSWTVFGMGWHPWSICRGIGFCFIIFEVCSISLGRLTGSALSNRRRRAVRWLVGIGFLSLDAALKYVLLEPVRAALAGNLM
jgi:hypothetical protein